MRSHQASAGPAAMLTYRDALTRAADQLSMHPELRPRAMKDAVLLLMESLQITRTTLIAHPERKIDREQQRNYQALLERRLRFEPIQYITGVAHFYGLELSVAPGVLIPRPETELLVEAVLARAAMDARIVDVGTGSGAIALALAQARPRAAVTGLDDSTAALEQARGNAEALKLEVRWMESDLLAAVAGEAFDVVVSNPPYIAEGERASLATQVKDFEPAQALFAGESGLEVYQRLIPRAHAALRPGGMLALEIGFGQQGAVEALLAGWDNIEVLRDLQAIARVILAYRKEG